MMQKIAETENEEFISRNHFLEPKAIFQLEIQGFALSMAELKELQNLNNLALIGCSLRASKLYFFEFITEFVNFPILGALKIKECTFLPAQDNDLTLFTNRVAKNYIESVNLEMDLNSEQLLVIMQKFNEFSLENIVIKGAKINVREMEALFPFLCYFNDTSLKQPEDMKYMEYCNHLQKLFVKERKARILSKSEQQKQGSVNNSAVSESSQQNIINLSAKDFSEFEITKQDYGVETCDYEFTNNASESAFTLLDDELEVFSEKQTETVLNNAIGKVQHCDFESFEDINMKHLEEENEILTNSLLQQEKEECCSNPHITQSQILIEEIDDLLKSIQ